MSGVPGIPSFHVSIANELSAPKNSTSSTSGPNASWNSRPPSAIVASAQSITARSCGSFGVIQFDDCFASRNAFVR